jgi:Protein of unknown function (DUF2924)
MARRMIHPSREATPAGAAAPKAPGVAAMDAAASPKQASVGAGLDDAGAGSLSVAPPRAEASILTRRARAHSPQPASAVAAPVEADIETREAPTVLKRAPQDGDLIRRRWRSLIGRHPPKTLSHALMDRILAWREQVAEGGDINSRSRAILAAALGGKTAGAEKDGQVQDKGNERNFGAHGHRPHAPVRVGTTLIREHAGVLHRVTVVAEGFEWEGRTYASPSAVARAITGVRWNGRRFFALDRSAKSAGEPRAHDRDAGARRTSRRLSEPSRAGDAT